MIIIGLSIVFSLTVNAVSPNGIPLFGAWNTKKGVATARSLDPDESFLKEIKNVEAAKALFDRGGSLFVDARHPDAYHEGHIPGAVSLPAGRFSSRIDSFKSTHDPNIPIITYCSGRECEDSHKLAELLFMNGYTNIRVFIDGYPGWLGKGYPSEP